MPVVSGTAGRHARALVRTLTESVEAPIFQAPTGGRPQDSAPKAPYTPELDKRVARATHKAASFKESPIKEHALPEPFYSNALSPYVRP